MSDKSLTVYKLLAVGAALLYLYKMTQKSGGSMAGKYSPESFAHLASQLVPQEYRPHAKQMGVAILNRIIQ